MDVEIPDVIIYTDPNTGVTCTIQNDKHNQGYWLGEYGLGEKTVYPETDSRVRTCQLLNLWSLIFILIPSGGDVYVRRLRSNGASSINPCSVLTRETAT